MYNKCVRRIVRALKSVPEPTASLAQAVFPDKEIWKSEPGNRYTSEELREMDRLWDIQLVDPDAPTCRSAD
jgi:hypothetical protein